MSANTDPVLAHDELRVQAALLRTPEFMAQFDPDKFAGQLERIASALARQPAAVDEECMKRDIATQAAEIEALRAEVGELHMHAKRRDQYAVEKAAQALDWKKRAERLAEALRELEEREQRDEGLLRQALEVLSRAHQAAMVQTLKARIPECAEFGGIAQDLDFVVAALRERLGEGAEP